MKKSQLTAQLVTKIMFYFFLSSTILSRAQCNGAELISNSYPSSLLPQGCDTSFSGTSKKYKYQSFYVPTLADPVITLKMVVHVFTPTTNDVHAFNNGSGYYNNLAALKRRYAVLCTDPVGGTPGQKNDRYSNARQANYYVPNLTIPAIADSRIQYEVVAYYFYTSDQYYYGTQNGLPSEPPYLDSAQTIPNPSYNPKVYNQDSAMRYINRNFPERLGEGLAIIMMSAGQAMTTFNSSVAGRVPYLTIEHYAGNSNASETGNNKFAAWQLRHELGHCFGLLHAYYGKPCFTGPGSPSPETYKSGKLDCNNIDYLPDLFPKNNPNAASNSYPLPTSCPMPYLNSCNSMYEGGDTALHNSSYTNNMMTDNVVYSGSPGGLTWMSPLQMGRRIRSMHFKSDAYGWYGVANWANIRFYAKETRSEKLYPLVIDSNETWAFDIQMYKDIVIKKDRTLTIKCKVSMATDGKIIVEKGGKLIIDGGEVTGWCKKTPVNSYKNSPLWFGIEVRGNTNQNQLINNSTGYCPNQGIVEVKNNGTISYAQNGIYTGYSWAGALFPSGNSGGIVIANNANFINNVYDILFFKFTQNPIRSKLVNCRFLTTGEIGKDGNGNLIKPEEHVKLFENDGLYFDNCTFENTSTAYSYFTSGTGISSYNSNFNVGFNSSAAATAATKCTFKNLMVGIRIDNSNPLATANIKYSDFTYNTYKAIIAENVYNLDITENTFKTENTEVGVYAYQCKYYKIRNNYFVSPRTYESTGIGVYSSGSGAHSLYRNSFSKMMYSIIAMDNNGNSSGNGLKMNCNNFVPLVTCCDNKWDIAVTKSGVIPTIDPDQGLGGSAKTLVRNIYHANYFNSSVRNKFFVDPTNTQVINHASNSTQSTKPNSPYNQSSTQVVVTSPGLIALDYPNHCEAYPAAGPQGSNSGARLSDLNNYLALLKADNIGNKNLFEIQSAVSSKLNIFSTDTLAGSQDSIISILTSNQGLMDDADIQLVFAYVKKGDFINATNKKNALPTSKSAWKDLLTKVLAIEQDSLGASGIAANSSTISFLQGYAATEAGDGQATAQAYLSVANGYTHSYPLVYPDGGLTSKSVETSSIPDPDLEIIADSRIEIYPNPTQSGITIVQKNLGGQTLKIEVRDLLGKVIFTTFIKELDENYISLKEYDAGVYLLSVYENEGKLVYKTKLIKQN